MSNFWRFCKTSPLTGLTFTVDLVIVGLGSFCLRPHLPGMQQYAILWAGFTFWTEKRYYFQDGGKNLSKTYFFQVFFSIMPSKTHDANNTLFSKALEA